MKMILKRNIFLIKNVLFLFINLSYSCLNWLSFLLESLLNLLYYYVLLCIFHLVFIAQFF